MGRAKSSTRRPIAWDDAGWRGRPWAEAVVYELHIGAFTPEGTFRAAVAKLDHLAALGVTAIEIMPIGDFPGRRNWGYDGVLPYAPDSRYGRPEDLKALVDAAHARGLMVLLDVVYNHFGPEGAYIHPIAPQIFTDRHKTPWGAAVNFDGPTQPAGARVRHPQRPLLDRGVPFRRAAARRGARDPRRQPEASFGGAGRARARRGGRPACSPRPGERREPCGSSGAPARAASRAGTRRSGTTTSITCCMSRRAARPRATTPTTTATPRSSAALWREGLRFRASRCPTAGGRAARPAPSCRRLRLSPSSRTTTRSATARSATASPTSRRRRRCARSQRSTCCCRRFRCCSWVRNGVRRSPFRSFAISGRSWPMRYARAGARSSRAFRNFTTRQCASASPTRWPRRPSPPPSSAGRTSRARRMPGGSTGIAGYWRCAMPRSCRFWLRSAPAGVTRWLATRR